jgi:D-alanine-D-alanine ligase
MVRVDFILLEGSNDFYFIEINTTPGQSAASLIPQQVRAAGYGFGEFYSALIEGAAFRISDLGISISDLFHL